MDYILKSIMYHVAPSLTLGKFGQGTRQLVGFNLSAFFFKAFLVEMMHTTATTATTTWRIIPVGKWLGFHLQAMNGYLELELLLGTTTNHGYQPLTGMILQVTTLDIQSHPEVWYDPNFRPERPSVSVFAWMSRILYTFQRGLKPLK